MSREYVFIPTKIINLSSLSLFAFEAYPLHHSRQHYTYLLKNGDSSSNKKGLLFVTSSDHIYPF